MPRKLPACLALAVALVLGLPGRPAHSEQALPSINLPLEDWTVIAYAKGFLQEAYARIGTSDVRLVDPGTTQLSGSEAALLDRGGLALAQRMMYPATIHKANGIDASIVWLSTRSSPARTPVLALADSPIQTVADLKGKTVAVTSGTNTSGKISALSQQQALDLNVVNGSDHAQSFPRRRTIVVFGNALDTKRRAR